MDAPSAPGIGALLQINQHLNVACCRPDCRRQVRLAAAEAVRLLGFSTPLSEARRRLRCQKCGDRGRDGFLEAWPCTLDLAAWQLRQDIARAAATGKALPFDAQAHMATLERLTGMGELGGDGPVQWPIEPPSMAV